MASLSRIIQKKKIVSYIRVVSHSKPFSDRRNIEDPNDEFRVFDIRNKFENDVAKKERYVKPPPPPPREHQMPTDQDWTNVWPGPRTFHPASVPLPVKQGFDHRGKLPPSGKYANAELMKLPNFLHLTPPAIKKHCEALQKFCTPWPKELANDEEIDKHFPLQVTTTDYCHSSPKIRDPKARIVTFQFKLSHLALDKHSKDKIQRLLGPRYNDESDIVTLTSDRCPLRKQNLDYNQYLLLAIFYESWKTEKWEEEKVEEDMEYYDWERNASKKSYLALNVWRNRENDQAVVSESSLLSATDLPAYKEAVTELMNKGETAQNLFHYKEAVLKMVF